MVRTYLPAMPTGVLTYNALMSASVIPRFPYRTSLQNMSAHRVLLWRRRPCHSFHTCLTPHHLPTHPIPPPLHLVVPHSHLQRGGKRERHKSIKREKGRERQKEEADMAPDLIRVTHPTHDHLLVMGGHHVAGMAGTFGGEITHSSFGPKIHIIDSNT